MLHYSEYGAGRPLIILHGLLGSSENWVRIARELGVYFNVITVDLRNHGMSFHRDEMNYEVMAEDVMALMRYYSWDSPVIMGHSMGAKVALMIADRYEGDIAQLVQVDMVNKAYDHRHLDIINAMEGIAIGLFQSRVDLRRVLEKEIKDPALLGLILKNTIREADSLRWKVNIKAIKDNYSVLSQAVILDDVIDIPTLLVRGGEADYVSDSDLGVIEATFSAVEIKTIAGVGHWVHAEAPTLFLAEVLSFLGCDIL